MEAPPLVGGVIHVRVITKIIIDMDENIEVTEVLENMDYNFTSATEGADIVDHEIQEWEVTDSK